MTDHDQRFKVLLKEFFAEFLTLFFPERAVRFDLEHVEWLDKELFPDPPQGDVLVLDLVARLRLRNADPAAEATETVALIHIEVESREAVATFRRRMFEYYESLRRKYNLPVLPVAVYLRVGLDGIGIDGYEENFDDLDVLRFRYLYVGLPALEAERYVNGGNWLGVGLSALMRVPKFRRAWLRSESLRRLTLECKENDYRRLLLWECVEAYSELDEQQQGVYKELLLTDRYKEIEPMQMTTYEKGMDKGKRSTTRLLLEHKWGPLSAAVLERLETWPTDGLDELCRAALDGHSLRELGLED